MTSLFLLGLGAAIGSAVCFGIAAVVQASAVRDLGSQGDSLRWLAVHMWVHPPLLAVLIAYLAGFWLHAVAIWLLPLYLAQATVSLSLPITAWVAARRLREPMGTVAWMAVAAVVMGMVLLAFGSGKTGTEGIGTWFVVSLWLLVITLTVAGVGGRFENGVELGALAGLGYAGTAIGVRGVTGTAESELTRVASAVAVPVLGMLAFWLYSKAMSRGTVAVASSLVIVGQTMIPAFVGLLALGDRVAAGREWAVGVGLVAAMAGAVVLSRRQERSLQLSR
jgi:drug/metabolite transporter (DMT)-like permease